MVNVPIAGIVAGVALGICVGWITCYFFISGKLDKENKASQEMWNRNDGDRRNGDRRQPTHTADSMDFIFPPRPDDPPALAYAKAILNKDKLGKGVKEQ